MTRRNQSFRFIWAVTVLLILLPLTSCSDRDAPTAATAEKLLTTYYGEQGYRILSLDLGGIEGAPAAQKTYGRKRAYYVTVNRIELERQGKKMVREKATVIIRQKPGGADEWTIEQVPASLAP